MQATCAKELDGDMSEVGSAELRGDSIPNRSSFVSQNSPEMYPEIIHINLAGQCWARQMADIKAEMARTAAAAQAADTSASGGDAGAGSSSRPGTPSNGAPETGAELDPPQQAVDWEGYLL